VKDAAASIGDSVAAIADTIIGHAEVQGINPAQEQAALYTAQSKAKAEAATPDKLAEALTAIGKEVAELTTTAATVNRFPSRADFEAAWQKDNDRDFSPALFDPPSLNLPQIMNQSTCGFTGSTGISLPYMVRFPPGHGFHIGLYLIQKSIMR
jgi:hypothetical protein